MARPVVLVHGAYHQPAHYEPLLSILREHTAIVEAPDVGTLILGDSTALVQGVVDRLPEPPVAIGHSWGGAVVGALSGVHQMIFLDAFILDLGETAGSVLAAAAEQDPGASAEFMGALRPSDDGTLFSIDPAAAPALLYGDCDPETTAWAVGLLRSDIAANFQALPTAAAWHDTPSLFIRCTEDRTFPPSLAHANAARCAEATTIETSHAPFLSRPRELADLILPRLA